MIDDTDNETVTDEPTALRSTDEDASSPSTNEDTHDEFTGSSKERDEWMARDSETLDKGHRREPRDTSVSSGSRSGSTSGGPTDTSRRKDDRGGDGFAETVDERRTQNPHRSSRGDARSHCPSDGGAKRSTGDNEEPTRDNNLPWIDGQQSGANDISRANDAEYFDVQDSVFNTARSTPPRRMNPSDAHIDGDKCSVADLHQDRTPGSCKDDFDDGESIGGQKRGRGNATPRAKEANPEPRSAKSLGNASGSNTEGRVSVTDENLRSERHEDPKMTPSRASSLEGEHVETIELDECQGYNHLQCGFRTDRALVETRPKGETGNGSPVDEQKCSNQDEDREIEQREDADSSIPPLEILTWEGPHQGKSATSRLHRHISGIDTQGAEGDSLPPPKEFLSNPPPEHVTNVENDDESAASKNRPSPETESARPRSALKPPKNGRRRSAADLEWSDGRGTRDVSLKMRISLVEV